jgi:hypothetical protein
LPPSNRASFRVQLPMKHAIDDDDDDGDSPFIHPLVRSLVGWLGAFRVTKPGHFAIHRKDAKSPTKKGAGKQAKREWAERGHGHRLLGGDGGGHRRRHQTKKYKAKTKEPSSEKGGQKGGVSNSLDIPNQTNLGTKQRANGRGQGTENRKR